MTSSAHSLRRRHCPLPFASGSVCKKLFQIDIMYILNIIVITYTKEMI